MNTDKNAMALYVRVVEALPSNRNLSPLVRAFKDSCASYFETHPLA